MQANTIEILNSINLTVSNIAKMMAPQNLSTPKGVASLSKGISAPKQESVGVDVKMSATSIDSIKAMSSISPVVMSFKDIDLIARNRMKRAIQTVVESLDELSRLDDRKINSDNILSLTTKIIPALVEFDKISGVNTRRIKKTVEAFVGSVEELYALNNAKIDIKNVSDSITGILPVITDFSKIDGVSVKSIKRTIKSIVEALDILEKNSSRKIDTDNLSKSITNVVPVLNSLSGISNIGTRDLKMTIKSFAESVDILSSEISDKKISSDAIMSISSVVPAIVDFSRISNVDVRSIRRTVNLVVDTLEQLSEYGNKDIKTKQVYNALTGIIPILMEFSHMDGASVRSVHRTVRFVLDTLDSLEEYGNKKIDINNIVKTATGILPIINEFSNIDGVSPRAIKRTVKSIMDTLDSLEEYGNKKIDINNIVKTATGILPIMVEFGNIDSVSPRTIKRTVKSIMDTIDLLEEYGNKKVDINNIVKTTTGILPIMVEFGNINNVHVRQIERAVGVIVETMNELSSVADKKFDYKNITKNIDGLIPNIIEFGRIDKSNVRQVKRTVGVFIETLDMLGTVADKKFDYKNITNAVNDIIPAIIGFSEINNVHVRQIKRTAGIFVETINMLSVIADKKTDYKNITKAVNDIVPAIVEFSKIENANTRQIRRVVTSAVNALNELYTFGKTHSDMEIVAKSLSRSTNSLTGVISTLNTRTRIRRGAISEITNTVMGLTAVTAAMIGLGVLISKGDTAKILLSGFATLGLVMVATATVITLTGLAGKLIGSTGVLSGMKDIVAATIGMGVLVAAMMGLGMIISNGDSKKIIINGLVGLAAVMVATTALVGLTALAAQTITTTKGIAAIGSVLIFTFASMGLVVASKYLGDFIIDNNKEILKGFEYTGGVLVGLGVIAAVAGRVLGSVTTGIVALGAIELMAFGAMGLMFAVTKLTDRLKQYDAKDLANTVLGIGGIISAFGVIAGIAGIGPVAAAILIGSAALGAVELMAFGAIKLVDAVMGLHTRRTDANLSWKQLEKDVLGVSGIVGTFGTLAAAASALTIPIAIATPALASITAFSLTCIGVMNKLFDLEKRIQDGGGIKKIQTLVNTDIPSVMKAFNYKNYNPGLNLIQIASLTTRYAAIAALSLEFLATATALSKLAKIGGLIKGNMILPVKKLNKDTGEMELGEPVDIVQTASSIMNAVHAFVSKCNYGFKDVAKMMTSAAVFKLLGTIVNPVTKFINMLTGFIGAGDSLTPVRIDDQGNVHIGVPVNVKSVAGIISTTISTFVQELYSEDNASKWAQYVYGKEDGSLGLFKNKKTKAIKKVAGILGVIVSPISEFAEMLTTLQGSADGKFLTPIIVDAEGNFKPGKPVDVMLTATTVSGAITTFVAGLFSQENIKSWNSLESKGRKAMETVFSSLTDIIGVVRDLGDEKSINNTNLEMNIASVQKLLDNVYREDFEKTTEKLTKFSNATIQLKSNISNLDKVLIEENNKRKKNIEDFGKSIEDLLKKFDNADKSIGNLYNLVMALQNMDSNRVSSIISSMNLNNYKGSNTVQPAQPAVQNITPVQKTITSADIANAIRDALDGMHITGGTMSENQSMDDSANAIVAALRNLRLDLDLN